MKKEETLIERIAGYGFMVVVLAGIPLVLTWFMGAGVLLVLEVYEDALETFGVPDLSHIDEVFGPILAGLPFAALIAAAIYWNERRAFGSSDIDAQENCSQTKRALEAVTTWKYSETAFVSSQSAHKIKLAHVFEKIKIGDDSDFEHSSAKITTFDCSVEPQQSGEEWISHHVLCPVCHEHAELRCFQQEMVHLSASVLCEDDEAREKVRKYFGKGPLYYFLAIAGLFAFLTFVWNIFLQVEFVEKSISLSELFDPNSKYWEQKKDVGYLIYYLGWIFGPLCIGTLFTWGYLSMVEDRYLSRSQTRSLEAGDLTVILMPKLARKAGLTDLQQKDRTMRLRSLLNSIDGHAVVNKGNYNTPTTDWNVDAITTTTGDDIWVKRLDLSRENNDNCVEFGVRYWRSSWF